MRIDYFPNERPDAPLRFLLLGRNTGAELLMPSSALRVLDFYAFHLVIGGKGYYRERMAERRLVQRGDLVISYPGRPHEFNPLPGQAIDLYYIAFAGPLADTLFAHVDTAGQAVFSAGLAPGREGMYAEIIALARTGIPYHLDRAHALLHSLLVESLYLKNSALIADEHHDACARFISFAQQHLAATELPLSAFLLEEGISHEAFRKRFRRITGQAPHAYWLDQKIAAAKELLFQDQCTVQEVALSLGFQDAFYFSRLFKARTGMSPTLFRHAARQKLF